MNLTKALVASAIVAAFGAGSAHAGGVIGDLINNVAPGVGTQLDQMNANLGQPFDHAVAAAANTIVPGSQAAIEGYWAAQRSGMLPNIQLGQPGFNAPVQQRPMPAFGVFCATPAGRFGPGPVNPVGAPCQAITPWGLVGGTVTQ